MTCVATLPYIVRTNYPLITKAVGRTSYEETDYYAMKWSPVACKTSNDESGYFKTFENEMYGIDGWTQGANNQALDNIHDLVLIRFADVLLMQSELKGDATGMNKVRERAGLPAIGYSLQLCKTSAVGN